MSVLTKAQKDSRLRGLLLIIVLIYGSINIACGYYCSPLIQLSMILLAISMYGFIYFLGFKSQEDRNSYIVLGFKFTIIQVLSLITGNILL